MEKAAGEEMTPWPVQTKAVDLVNAARGRGERRILATLPTGGGKTFIMRLLAEKELEGRGRVVMYTNRRMLIDQTSDVLMDAGMYHGVRAAGYADERDHPFQIASIQTEHSRVVKRGRWELHDASLVLVDEAHLQKEKMALDILKRHVEAGAAVVGFTATPLDLGEFYTHLIVAGNNSDLRACGAIVPAIHYGPDEPDIKALKKVQEGKDLTENQARKAMMTPTIWGRVWDNFEKLNPEHKPTILFAPGVRESIWFAEQFSSKGVPAAHIDGDHVWIGGELHRSSRELRQEVLNGSRDGRVVVLCNRFVLREGIDAPWLSHGIFATVFGSLQTYLQSGGRLLRAHDSLSSVTVQDHGGNWWRHGSLNEDREWFLEQTAEMAYGLRADRIRNKKKSQPFRCPRCGRIWTKGIACLPVHGGCGYELTSFKRSRPVVTTEGTLREMTGDIFRPKSISKNPDGPYKWRIMLKRSRTVKGQRTFRQAAALFARENFWQWPDPMWPGMPIDERDWYLLVTDVPPERLRGGA